jgi:hypothetical protein
VSNVYSAVISAGGVGVLLSAALERRYRNGLGLIAAAIVGLGTLVGAHGIAPGGAGALATQVLDVEFWLAAAATVIAIALPKMSPLSGFRASMRVKGAMRALVHRLTIRASFSSR